MSTTDRFQVSTSFPQRMLDDFFAAVHVRQESPEISVTWEMPSGGTDIVRMSVKTIEVQAYRYWTLKGKVLGIKFKPGSSEDICVEVDTVSNTRTITWG